MAAQEADLLPVPYFHIVFTLPAQIAAIAYHNKAVVYDLLFKAASEHHAYSALTHLGRVFRGCLILIRHGSSLSKVGASCLTPMSY